MRNLHLLLLSIISLIYITSSCDSDDTISNDDSYYVKYEVSFASGDFKGIPIVISATTDKGLINAKTTNGAPWEASYGPFKKGDKVKITIELDKTYTYYERYLPKVTIKGRIYTTKNSEPYVIKAEGSSLKQLTLNYTIDY